MSPRILRKSPHGAFTLVEVLVSILVLSLTAAAVYVSLTSLSRQELFVRDRQTAKNILTSTFEQLRQNTVNNDQNFYNINASTYPASGSWVAVNMPGYPANYFQKKTVFLSEQGDVKRMLITVQWMENGNQKNVNHVFVLGRPRYALPGNIHGVITNCSTNGPLADAQVQIIEGGVSGQIGTNNNGSYNFSSSVGSFSLPPGNYRLRVSKDGFENYEIPAESPLQVQSGEDKEFNTCIEPFPEATIRGALTGIKPDGTSIGLTGVYLTLWDDGVSASNIAPSNIAIAGQGGAFNFTVQIPTGMDQRCLTLATGNGIVENLFPYLGGNTYGFKGCSRSCPAIVGWTVGQGATLNKYNYRGWSSSQARDEVYTPAAGYSNVACGNPWEGNASADRICVAPGDDKAVNITLDSVPTASISGTLYKSDGTPAGGGAVIVYWKNSQVAFVGADSNGQYTIPAITAYQELFPNQSNNYVYLVAYYAYTGSANCCGQTQTYNNSSGSSAGPLYAGTNLTKDFHFPPESSASSICGNVGGTISEYVSSSSISGASVALVSTGYASSTNSSGNYSFTCPNNANGKIQISGASLSQGYNIGGNGGFFFFAGSGSGNSYYPRSSAGTDFYKPQPNITIYPNLMTTLNSSILQAGFGTIQGVVSNAATGDVLPNIEVKFKPFTPIGWIVGTGYNTSVSSSSGQYSKTMIESWPPQRLSLDDFTTVFKEGPYTHSITANAQGPYYNPHYETKVISDIELQRNETKTIDIPLAPLGSGW